MAAPGNLDLLELWNTFASPQAKEARLRLRQQQEADKYYHSPEYLAQSGGAPVSANEAMQALASIGKTKADTNLATQQGRGVQVANNATMIDQNSSGGHSLAFMEAQPQIRQGNAAAEGTEIGNSQAKMDSFVNGGQSNAGYRMHHLDQPMVAPTIDHTTALADMTRGQANLLSGEMADAGTVSGGTLQTPEGVQMKQRGESAAGDAAYKRAETDKTRAETTAYFPTDPNQQAMFMNVMKSLGYDTSKFEAEVAKKNSAHQETLKHIKSLDPAKTSSPVSGMSVQPSTGQTAAYIKAPNGMQIQSPVSETNQAKKAAIFKQMQDAAGAWSKQ